MFIEGMTLRMSRGDLYVASAVSSFRDVETY